MLAVDGHGPFLFPGANRLAMFFGHAERMAFALDAPATGWSHAFESIPLHAANSPIALVVQAAQLQLNERSSVTLMLDAPAAAERCIPIGVDFVTPITLACDGAATNGLTVPEAATIAAGERVATFEITFPPTRCGNLDTVNIRGARTAVEPLQGLFAATILKQPALPPDPPDDRVYDLNPLREPGFEFVYERTWRPTTAAFSNGCCVKTSPKRLRQSSEMHRQDNFPFEARRSRHSSSRSGCLGGWRPASWPGSSAGPSACPCSAASACHVATCATIAGRSVTMGLDTIRGAQAGGVRRPPSPVGLEFVIRPPLEAGPCPGSGRSNAHG